MSNILNFPQPPIANASGKANDIKLHKTGRPFRKEVGFFLGLNNRPHFSCCWILEALFDVTT